MEFVTRDQFNQTITASELVEALETMGYLVLIEKRPALTPEQRQFVTKKIFSEPDILRQIDEAKAHLDDDDMDYFSGDEEQFAKLVDKVNGR